LEACVVVAGLAAGRVLGLAVGAAATATAGLDVVVGEGEDVVVTDCEDELLAPAPCATAPHGDVATRRTPAVRYARRA
jgi:hypothetical protein